MLLNPRRALVAAITMIALGAGAAPALATTTPTSDPQLAASLARYDRQITERIDLGSASGFRAAIPVLTANIGRSIRAESAVSHLPVPSLNHYSRYQRAVAYWSTGGRLQAAADAELVRGIEESGRPDYPALDVQDRTALRNLALARDYLSYASNLAGADPGPLPAALGGDAPIASVAPTHGARVVGTASPLASAIHSEQINVNRIIFFNPWTFHPRTFRGFVLLEQDVRTCVRAAQSVGRVHPSGHAQSAARAYWTTAALLKAAGDGEIIEGLNARGHETQSGLDEQDRLGVTTIELADAYFAYADNLLAGHAGAPPAALR